VSNPIRTEFDRRLRQKLDHLLAVHLRNNIDESWIGEYMLSISASYAKRAGLLDGQLLDGRVRVSFQENVPHDDFYLGARSPSRAGPVQASK
jgi:hypothetical protein